MFSSLGRNSKPLQDLQRHETMESALEKATSLVSRNAQNGVPPTRFYILKAVAVVEVEPKPVVVTQLE